MNDKGHTVLCVDDEESILRSLKRLLRREDYRLLIASSGKDGLRLLRENIVHLVISDQRMPGMSGTEFLAQVKEQYPDVLRICLTGYTDVDTITESVNMGLIYKFFLKPWNDQNLKQEIRLALEQYDLIKANKKLHEKVYKQNMALTKINNDLEKLVRERTKELEQKNNALELWRAFLENLPIAVIGVNAEGMIELINRAAQSLSPDGVRMELGENLSHYFSSDVEEKVKEVIKTNISQIIDKKYILSGNAYYIDLLPLAGDFYGKAMMVAIRRMGQMGG